MKYDSVIYSFSPSSVTGRRTCLHIRCCSHSPITKKWIQVRCPHLTAETSHRQVRPSVRLTPTVLEYCQERGTELSNCHSCSRPHGKSESPTLPLLALKDLSPLVSHPLLGQPLPGLLALHGLVLPRIIARPALGPPNFSLKVYFIRQVFPDTNHQ